VNLEQKGVLTRIVLGNFEDERGVVFFPLKATYFIGIKAGVQIVRTDVPNVFKGVKLFGSWGYVFSQEAFTFSTFY